MQKKYDLVTIRQYNGEINGKYEWILLSYAIVIKKEGLTAVCMRDENVQYQYLPLMKVLDTYCLDHSDLEKGDIRIFHAFDKKFETIYSKTKASLERYMNESSLFFDGDTTYGVKLNKQKSKKVKKLFYKK